MSEAKKYDKSYKEQSVKLALEIEVKRASEELKVPYGTTRQTPVPPVQLSSQAART